MPAIAVMKAKSEVLHQFVQALTTECNIEPHQIHDEVFAYATRRLHIQLNDTLKSMIEMQNDRLACDAEAA